PTNCDVSVVYSAASHPPCSTLFPYTTLFRSKFSTTLAQISERALSFPLLPAKVEYPRISNFIPLNSATRARFKGMKFEIRGYSTDRKSTRLNSSHGWISYGALCLKKRSHRAP